MRTNQVKEKLKRGEPALGAWLSLPSVPSARIMARLGFDWLVVDMEHSAQNPVLMADIVVNLSDARTGGPIVRVPNNMVVGVISGPEGGAGCVIVLIGYSRDEAKCAVEVTLYQVVA